MAQSHLPSDPLAAHAVVMQRAQQVMERRSDERRKPLPEHAEATVSFTGRPGSASIQAEVLDVSSGGMRLAAFAHAEIQIGDGCLITLAGSPAQAAQKATVRWVKPHPMIQVFGVQFDAPTS